MSRCREVFQKIQATVLLHQSKRAWEMIWGSLPLLYLTTLLKWWEDKQSSCIIDLVIGIIIQINEKEIMYELNTAATWSRKSNEMYVLVFLKTSDQQCHENDIRSVWNRKVVSSYYSFVVWRCVFYCDTLEGSSCQIIHTVSILTTHWLPGP